MNTSDFKVAQIESPIEGFNVAFCYKSDIVGAMSFEVESAYDIPLPLRVANSILNTGSEYVTTGGLFLDIEYQGQGLAPIFWAKAEALRAKLQPQKSLRFTKDISFKMIEQRAEKTRWTSRNFALMQSLLQMEGACIKNYWQQDIYGMPCFLWDVKCSN